MEPSRVGEAFLYLKYSFLIISSTINTTITEMDISKYKDLLKSAIRLFWHTRNSQRNAQSEKEIKDTGNRRAVTGGSSYMGN
jgi:hypothetical protein